MRYSVRMSCIRRARRFVCLCLLGISVRAQEASQFSAYPVGDTDLAAAEQVVRSVLTADDTVARDEKGRRLLIMAPDSRQRKVADIMAKLNPPARNIRIQVKFRGTSRQEEREASVRGQGQVVLTPGGVSGTIKLQPRVVNELSTGQRDTTQLLLVASGREASLRVGEEVPYLDWVNDYGLSHGWLTQRIAWQRVGASLIVQPTLIGDGPDLRIRIIPELSGQVNGQVQRIRFAEAATELVARDGQPLQLAGFDEHREFYDRFLVGLRKGGQAETLSIELTPQVMPVGRAAGPGEAKY